MAPSSLQSSDDTAIAHVTRRKRSFTFPSFRKTAAAEEQAAIKDSSTRATDQANQERARIRKAAAWQWYTRGVGEVVVPTNISSCTAGSAAQLQRQNSADQLPKSVLTKSHCPPSFPAGHRSAAVSRFKAEADANSASGRRPPAGGRAAAAPATLTAATPRTPLYDDFELSGLKTQMADFVHRLQQKPEQRLTKAQHSDSSAPSTHAPGAADQISSHPNLAAAPGGAEAPGSGLRRPIAALHRLFRKLVMSFPKKSGNSPSTTATPESEEIPVDEPLPEGTQYHYHHYIHHHHHHYHYGGRRRPSLEDEMQDTRVRRRRHSESSGIQYPPLDSSIWGELEYTDAEEEEEESPISAFLVRRRRRYSDSAFAGQLESVGWKAQVGGLQEKPAKICEQKQLLRRLSSDGFMNVNKQQNDHAQGGEVESAEEKGQPWQVQNADLKSSIRRQFSESFREGGMANVRWTMKPAAEEARRAGGRIGGGGVYKLGGGPNIDAPGDVIGQRRRHSESLGRQAAERNVIHEDIEQVIQYGMAARSRGSAEMMIRGPPSPARAQPQRQPPAAFLQRQPRSSSLRPRHETNVRGGR